VDEEEKLKRGVWLGKGRESRNFEGRVNETWIRDAAWGLRLLNAIKQREREEQSFFYEKWEVERENLRKGKFTRDTERERERETEDGGC
jgi:hypothetical protein